ncbi:MAG: response regulator transcription factor [bacterium]|nr:response regulator transcription factor [bacterium]
MRVLVVEDKPHYRNQLALQLSSENMHVDTASTARDGLFKAQVNRYSAILLDLNLPDGDGLTVCHEIRQDGISTPIMMLTVRDEIEDKVKGLETGADDYLTKPYSPRELTARIQALTRRGSKQSTCIYRTDYLMLDTRARQLLFHNQELTLTRREFDLLQYFLEHDREVVNREQIWEEVWGWDDYPLHNTVDVHVKRLRAKLKDRAGKMIQTVRGIGYRFVA